MSEPLYTFVIGIIIGWAGTVLWAADWARLFKNWIARVRAPNKITRRDLEPFYKELDRSSNEYFVTKNQLRTLVQAAIDDRIRNLTRIKIPFVSAKIEKSIMTRVRSELTRMKDADQLIEEIIEK